MTNWRKASVYCTRCRSWRTELNHLQCKKGQRKSLVWIDLDSFRQGCNRCNETWALEGSRFRCSCGHWQTTEYMDEIGVLQAGEQIVATDGDIVYVQTRTGTIVVGKRSFPTQGYQ